MAQQSTGLAGNSILLYGWSLGLGSLAAGGNQGVECQAEELDLVPRSKKMVAVTQDLAPNSRLKGTEVGGGEIG